FSPSSQYHSSPALVLLTLNLVFTTSEWSQHFLNGKRVCAALVSSALRYHCCTSNGWLAYSGFQVAPAGDTSTSAAAIAPCATMHGARAINEVERSLMDAQRGPCSALPRCSGRRTNPMRVTFVPRRSDIPTRAGPTERVQAENVY